jgi:hypothetical protein
VTSFEPTTVCSTPLTSLVSASGSTVRFSIVKNCETFEPFCSLKIFISSAFIRPWVLGSVIARIESIQYWRLDGERLSVSSAASRVTSSR